MENNYNHLWKEIIQRRLYTADRTAIKNTSKEEAEKYAAFTGIWEDGKKRAAHIHVEPSDTVLEIGAGPGTISFELAKKAAWLTAIEPACGMIEVFYDEAKKRNITNIEAVQSFWEDYVLKTQYDVVVSSLSLLTLDIRQFLQKMNAAARKRVYIHWFASESTFEKQIREVAAITGKPAAVLIPKIDIIFNILYGMNIIPEIRLLKTTHFDRVYYSLEETLQSIKKMCAIETDSYDTQLIAYINDTYEHKGSAYVYYDKTQFAELRWEKSPQCGYISKEIPL